MDKSKRHLAWWGVGALAVAAVVAWLLLRPAGVPEGFAVSNGRIEATEVDIASKNCRAYRHHSGERRPVCSRR